MGNVCKPNVNIFLLCHGMNKHSAEITKELNLKDYEYENIRKNSVNPLSIEKVHFFFLGAQEISSDISDGSSCAFFVKSLIKSSHTALISIKKYQTSISNPSYKSKLDTKLQTEAYKNCAQYTIYYDISTKKLVDTPELTMIINLMTNTRHSPLPNLSNTNTNEINIKSPNTNPMEIYTDNTDKQCKPMAIDTRNADNKCTASSDLDEYLFNVVMCCESLEVRLKNMKDGYSEYKEIEANKEEIAKLKNKINVSDKENETLLKQRYDFQEQKQNLLQIIIQQKKDLESMKKIKIVKRPININSEKDNLLQIYTEQLQTNRESIKFYQNKLIAAYSKMDKLYKQLNKLNKLNIFT